MTTKLTPWFPASVKPARPGVYLTAILPGARELYRLWNGHAWGFYGLDVQHAMERAIEVSVTQDYLWRGLAEQPE